MFIAMVMGICLCSGCSISYSSKSSSDSSRSSSESSSGPSTSDETRKAYEGDVTTYTFAIGTGETSPEDFLRGLSSIAEQHGITDWESYKPTYIAIGRGLKKTGISRDQLQELPYLQTLLLGQEKRLGYIKEGF